LVDSQENKDILNNIAAGDTNGDGVIDGNDNSLGEVISTYNKYININDAFIERAEDDVPASVYDTSAIYTAPVDSAGRPGDPLGLDASDVTVTDASDGDGSPDTSSAIQTSTQKVEGYLTGTALPPNGQAVQAGIAFPSGALVGDFYLRLDYIPNRLFRYDGKRWVKVEDAVRTNLTPGSENRTQRSSFVNDTNKFMSNAVVWDAIRVASNYTPVANAATLSFTLSNTSPYGTVVTKTPYVSSYGVKTFVNGTRILNTQANVAGNIGFTVTTPLSVNDVLEYTVYRHVINERQSLSQALRPSADNL
jgi:hypothetical protein